MTVASVLAGRDKISQLVRHFREHLSDFLLPDFKEAHVREEFINPFFMALGWDVRNDNRLPPQNREVVSEQSLDIEGHSKAPDYTFRFGQTPKFFVEAKKPAVDIATDLASAMQIRSYAWNAKLPLSILTGFDKFAVYDGRFRPSPRDKVSTARTTLMTFQEYPDRWQEIWDVFSREAIWNGAFDRFAQDTRAKRGTTEVDSEFLKEIEAWRDTLARNLATRNAKLSIHDLNTAVQLTIDRIIFLRIAEDMRIEPHGQLRHLAEGSAVFSGLTQLCRRADSKYNSGLFDFSKGGDTLTPHLKIDDNQLSPILLSLYYPHSPYRFDILPVELLGNVYEQFLGKIIRLTEGHHAKLEDKPEVKKAGGVYYTPSFIVDHIVANTVGMHIDGKSPQELRWFRVIDPACGSGSFLLGAFQALMDHYLRWYIDHEPAKYPKHVWNHQGSWRLTTSQKKNILISHVFGVDIDSQAVEVTKLSLLLKVLQGETDETLGKQLRLFHERALPNLELNIRCGNTLVSPEFLTEHMLIDADELQRVNPFSWKQEFPRAMMAGGFDCIIGNPPYIRMQMMREYAPLDVELFNTHYKSTASGNYDIYVVFVERALQLLKDTGCLGFIVPHKFMTLPYGEPIRVLIGEGRHATKIVHFGNQQVFDAATTYTCLLFLSKSASTVCAVTNVKDLAHWRLTGKGETSQVASDTLGALPWEFNVGVDAQFMSRLRRMPLTLEGDTENIYQGLATSADAVYVVEVIKDTQPLCTVASKALNGDHVKIEAELLRPILKGAEIERYSRPRIKYKVLFPYIVGADDVQPWTEREMERRFPRAYEYLKRNKNALLQRSKTTLSNWWLYPYPKNLSLYAKPKILSQVLSTTGAFTLDQKGEYYFLGGGTAGGNAIRCRNDDPRRMKVLLAILNSRLTAYHVSKVGSSFRGGFFAYGKASLKSLPLPSQLDRPLEDRLVAAVDRMLDLKVQLMSRTRGRAQDPIARQIKATDNLIEEIVAQAYALTKAEANILDQVMTS